MKDKIIKIIFSKHAKNKISERKLSESFLKEIIRNPDMIFYDIISKVFIAIRNTELSNVKTNLVVCFTKEKNIIKIVTAYPCKKIEKEIRKKEAKRWVRVK